MLNLTKVAYTTAATARGGRSGHVSSADGVIDLDTRPPSSSGPATANPETLFAAGYAACFQGALAMKAKGKGHDTSDSVVTAEVNFGPTDDGGFGLAVEMKVSIPDMDPALARELVDDAHAFCPYSKATAGNVQVTLTVE